MSQPNPYQELKKELERTAVISKEFRNQILGWAMACLQHGAEHERAVSLERMEEQERLHLRQRQFDATQINILRDALSAIADGKEPRHAEDIAVEALDRVALNAEQQGGDV